MRGPKPLLNKFDIHHRFGKVFVLKSIVDICAHNLLLCMSDFRIMHPQTVTRLDTTFSPLYHENDNIF